MTKRTITMMFLVLVGLSFSMRGNAASLAPATSETFCASMLQIPVDSDGDGVDDTWKGGNDYKHTLKLSGSAYSYSFKGPNFEYGESGKVHSTVQIPGSSLQVWRTINRIWSSTNSEGETYQALMSDGNFTIHYRDADRVIIETTSQMSVGPKELKKSNCLGVTP